MSDHVNKDKQSRDDDTNNKKKKTTKTNKLSCGSVHSVHESFVSFHMLQFIAHVVVLVALYFVSPIQLLSMHQNYSLSDMYGNSLQRLTLRKMVL